MRSHLKTLLLLAIVALLLWWFARNLDWSRIAADVRTAHWQLIMAGVCLVLLTYLLRALRWRTFLRPFAAVDSRELFAATTVGYSALFLVGRAGELARPAFLSLRDPRVRPAASFMTIAVERICDMTAIAMMFAASLLFVRAEVDETGARFAVMRRAGLLMLAGTIIGIICLALLRHYAPFVIRQLKARFENGSGIVARGGRMLTNLFEQLANALGVFTDVRALLSTVGWTTLLWTIITVVHLLVLRAFGLPLGIPETIFVMGCSLVGSLVPTPGGAAGTYHAATAGGLALLGVAEERAVATAFIMHLVVWSPALLFGLYYFLRSGVDFKRLREVAADRDEAPAQTTTVHVTEEATI